MHKPIALSAIQNGKHVICEKPLALDAQDAREIFEEAKKAGIKHAVGFNYRKSLAITFARQLIETGEIGKIFRFRGSFLQDFAIDPDVPISWCFKADKAGAGALGDIASQVIDVARYLVGEMDAVIGSMKTFVTERPPASSKTDSFGISTTRSKVKEKVDVDDSANFLIKFQNGAEGIIESTGFCLGRKNHLGFEINGEKGAIFFNWERNSELKFYSAKGPDSTQGFRSILMGPSHPRGSHLWALAGCGTGFIEPFVFEIEEFLTAIIEDTQFSPNFYDG